MKDALAISVDVSERMVNKKSIIFNHMGI